MSPWRFGYGRIHRNFIVRLTVFPFWACDYLRHTRQNYCIKILSLFCKYEFACTTVFPIEFQRSLSGSAGSTKEVEHVSVIWSKSE